MKSLRVVFIIIAVACLLQVDAGARGGRQAAQTPNRLALEVTYWKGNRPTYQTVPTNIWYGQFRQLAGWKAPDDFLPVQAVNIVSKMEGAGVRVIVSINQGKKLFEKQEAVGSYLLQENERLTVNDMTAFGLEPFEVAVVRIEPKSASVPAVTSNVRSIEVQDVQPVDATFPMFKLTLLNTSTRNVSVLFLEMFVDGRLRISAMPHNREGAPLILAGQTYEYRRQMNNNARQSGAGYAPEIPLNQSLLVKTVVFDDGTYEGDAALAARYRAFALGHRTQLQRIIARYQEALDAAEPDVKTVLANLRRQVEALGTEAALPAFDKLLKDFPAARDVTTLKSAVEVVMFELKKDTLMEIDEFALKQEPAPDREALRQWLATNRDRFQKWHDYLKKL